MAAFGCKKFGPRKRRVGKEWAWRKGKETCRHQQGKLKIWLQVDPKIIGGLVVEIGDNTIDLSVLSKITKLNSLLTQAV